MVVDETERLSRLADGFPLIAPPDQGRLPIRLERVSTRRLLETVRDRFVLRGEVLGRSIRTAEVHDDMIDADPLRIEQALGNLVDNALEHGTGDVTLSECRVNGTVELHVTDEGPGFDDRSCAAHSIGSAAPRTRAREPARASACRSSR